MLFPTFDALEARFERPLVRYQLLLDAGFSDGFFREWEPRALPPERHIGYAIQWFSFAGILAVMVIVLSVRSRMSFE
jgi:surfeit locus 1 family protein